MAYDWRNADQVELIERYVAGLVDNALNGDIHQSWRGFVSTIADITPDSFERRGRDALDDLLVRLPAKPLTPPRRVFVSHQRQDVAYAERIACLATQQGLDYWLDVHDPNLKLANRTLLPTDPRYALVIAAIIEIALLSSSHIIVVHTLNGLQSKWIPYELGRAKSRNIVSSQSGGWFDAGLAPAQFGSYVELSRIARGGESDVTAWLTQWSAKAGRLPWHGGATTPLP